MRQWIPASAAVSWRRFLQPSSPTCDYTIAIKVCEARGSVLGIARCSGAIALRSSVNLSGVEHCLDLLSPIYQNAQLLENLSQQ